MTEKCILDITREYKLNEKILSMFDLVFQIVTLVQIIS